MRRCTGFFFCVAGVLLATAFVATLSTSAAITKGPYIQNPSPTAVTIQWETDEPGSPPTVFFAAEETIQHAAGHLHEKVEYRQDPGDENSPVLTFYLYRARLTDLQPGTSYRYWVKDCLPGRLVIPPDPKRLTTWPEKAERVTFIAYGDSRSHPDRHRAVAEHFNKHSPAFVLHTGDCVANGAAYDQWGPQFFEPLADVIDHVPVLIARGNHEGGAENVLRLFDMPEGRTWFSFDYGPVHFVVLDYGKEDEGVLAWLEKDLAASKTPWKIAAYHVPTFNFGGHQSDAARTTFLPLFEKYGVDVVLTGHSHVYERFVPLRRAGDPGAQPITFITTGGGGAPLYDITEHPLLAKTAKVLHYCLFTADAKTLRIQTFTPDGKVLDALTISKKDGQCDETYLAQAQPMEAAILAQGLMRVKTPVLKALPTRQQAVPLVVRATFPGLRAMVTFSVRLADASAKAYRMDPVTVRVEPGKEVKAVLEIRARGEVTTGRVDGRPVLRQPLRFTLSAESDGIRETGETGDVGYRKP
ncbi:MAG: metallophosphoesterase family protein [Phycisphaerae bacterium]